ncbi:MAG: Fe-S cluster assembly protein SufD [Treponema sp.]
MKRNDYFKRLDYHIQDIPSAPFSGLSFCADAQSALYMPIDRFIETVSQETLAEIFDFSKSPREKNCGLGQHFIAEVYAKRNSGFYLKIEKDKTDERMKDFFVRFAADAAHPVLFDQSYIEVADGASARIILYFDTDENSPAPQSYRNGLMSIRIGKGAAVEIIKIQNFADTGFNFETVRMDAGEKSCVTVHDIHLGAQKTGASYSSYMQEEWADVHIYPLYFTDKQRRMDIEHNLIINGKNTAAEIVARGALKNEAHKIFRGNIFLNKGCAASAARFSDNSIMLDKNAVGTSIPTIFCDEDDVVGEHAASFVAIDKEKLYYIMSRGFDELSAKKLIIDSAFRPVFGRIPDETVRNKLNREFDARLSSEQEARDV